MVFLQLNERIYAQTSCFIYSVVSDATSIHFAEIT